MFVTLLRNHYEVFQTRAYLRDVVEGAHMYMRMMESYCQQNKHMVVQRKAGGGGKGKGRRKKGGRVGGVAGVMQREEEERWACRVCVGVEEEERWACRGCGRGGAGEEEGEEEER